MSPLIIILILCACASIIVGSLIAAGVIDISPPSDSQSPSPAPAPAPVPAPTPAAYTGPSYATVQTPTPPPPVDCVGQWTSCSRPCGGAGVQTYVVSTQAANGGRTCDFADRTTKPCSTPLCANNTICNTDAECASGYCDTSGDNYRCKDRPVAVPPSVTVAGTTVYIPPPPPPPPAGSSPCDCNDRSTWDNAQCGGYNKECT